MERQNLIYKFIKDRGEASLNDIIKAMPWSYYANGRKHIGVIIGRMVRKGILIRIKPGSYKINPHPYSQMTDTAIDPKQLEMF